MNEGSGELRVSKTLFYLREKLAKHVFRSCSVLQEIMVIVIGKNAQPIRTSYMSVTGF